VTAGLMNTAEPPCFLGPDQADEKKRPMTRATGKVTKNGKLAEIMPPPI